MYSLDNTIDIDTTDSNEKMRRDTLKCSINLITQTAQWEVDSEWWTPFFGDGVVWTNSPKWIEFFGGVGAGSQGFVSNLDKVIVSTVTLPILVIVIALIAMKMRQRNQLNNSQNNNRLPTACSRSLPATPAIGREDSSEIYHLVDDQYYDFIPEQAERRTTRLNETGTDEGAGDIVYVLNSQHIEPHTSGDHQRSGTGNKPYFANIGNDAYNDNDPIYVENPKLAYENL